MNRAIADVLAERRRHIEVEGWTPAHDDAHADGDLEKAAACYAMHTPSVKNLQRQKVKLWPWSPDWWKPDLGRRDLVKAGALILAAIERIDRAIRAAPWPLIHAPQIGLFQALVWDWMQACFGSKSSTDQAERNHRYLEESLELVQACGCSKSEALQLVEYVYGRPTGDKAQEVGGVMVTLSALCTAQGIHLEVAANDELRRVWTKIDVIRAKQAAKPQFSPLPGADDLQRQLRAAGDRRDWDEVDRLERIVDNGTTTPREWKRDNDATWCLLNLTGEGACVPESAIAQWTDEQCRQAEEWAGAAHLNASDNDDVVVPPIPEHVKASRRCESTFTVTNESGGHSGVRCQLSSGHEGAHTQSGKSWRWP